MGGDMQKFSLYDTYVFIKEHPELFPGRPSHLTPILNIITGVLLIIVLYQHGYQHGGLSAGPLYVSVGLILLGYILIGYAGYVLNMFSELKQEISEAKK